MNRSGLKIVLTYFFIGIAWIFISDHLLNWIYPDNELIYGQLIKGSFFVVVTSIFLYKFISRENMRILASKQQYKRMFDENPIPMWIYEPDTGKIIAVNYSALSSYDYTKDEFLKLGIRDLIPSGISDLNTFEESVIAKFAKKGVSLHKKKGNKLFFVQAKSDDTIFENRACKLVMAMDLHNLFVAESKIHLQNEKLKEIAFIQSHEIRRPIANIIGLTSLFKQQNTPPENTKEIIDKLHTVSIELDQQIKLVVEKTHELEKLNIDDVDKKYLI